MNSSTKQQRLVLLIGQDASRVLDRLNTHGAEALTILAIKRNRDHFDDVFRNRFEDLGISELSECNEQVVMSAQDFFHEVQELKWYFTHSEDQPQMMRDHLTRSLKKLKSFYDTLSLYIESDLRNTGYYDFEEEQTQEEFVSDETPPPFSPIEDSDLPTSIDD